MGDSKALIQLDMTKHEKYNVSRLIGSPPGYVGYEMAGRLTEQVRRSLIGGVVYKIDKAHPDGWNMSCKSWWRANRRQRWPRRNFRTPSS